MNALVIFRAYQKAEFWKHHEIQQRGSYFGIVVNVDDHAREYQRRDRQSKFFETALEQILVRPTQRATDGAK